MNRNAKEEKWIHKIALNVSRGVALIAAICILILSVLLIANFLQLKTIDPLNTPALQRLFERLQERPEDQDLKEEIRALDLLVRRAYFTRRWQIRTGGYMLLVGSLLLIVCMKSIGILRKKPVQPGKITAVESLWMESARARRSIIIGGALLLSIALTFAFLSHTSLRDDYLSLEPEDLSEGTGQGSPEDTVERVIAEEFKEDLFHTEDLLNNWPSFRGPGSIGRAYNTDPPVFWDAASGLGILWKSKVPKPGFNSPIIWDDFLFLSGADLEGQEVYCFDRNTGELLWQKAVAGIPGSPEEPPDVSFDTGYAAPTMTTDGIYVFAIFATGDLVCLNFQGDRVWALNLGVPQNHYGHSSSLIMYRNLLIVQYDHDGGARLLAMEASTGEQVWETERAVLTTWSSPIIVYTGKRPEIILNANPYVASYDPDTGKELWSVECMMGEVGPSPAYDEGMVFAVNQYALLAAIDVQTSEIVWEAYDDLPDAASPVAASGYLFVPTSYGVVSCLDAKTGEVYWIQEFETGSYSSPIYAGGRIYMMNKSGKMHIFKADSEYVSPGDPELGEESTATPAFIGSRIYIRGFEHLFCVENEEKEE